MAELRVSITFKVYAPDALIAALRVLRDAAKEAGRG